MAVLSERPDHTRREQGADSLRLAKWLADLLDQRFRIPGTSIRIGLDPLLGLIPGIGDLAANLSGSLILILAAQLGVPKVIILRMGINIAANALIGAIPIFGDVISIWYRSNSRNVALLQRYLGGAPRPAVFRDWLLVVALLIGLLLLLGGLVFAALWLIREIWAIFAAR